MSSSSASANLDRVSGSGGSNGNGHNDDEEEWADATVPPASTGVQGNGSAVAGDASPKVRRGGSSSKGDRVVERINTGEENTAENTENIESGNSKAPENVSARNEDERMQRKVKKKKKREEKAAGESAGVFQAEAFDFLGGGDMEEEDEEDQELDMHYVDEEDPGQKKVQFPALSTPDRWWTEDYDSGWRYVCCRFHSPRWYPLSSTGAPLISSRCDGS